MHYRINIYLKCGIFLLFTLYFVSVSFGLVIQKVTQELQDKNKTAETVKNRSQEVGGLQTTIRINASQALISENTTTLNDLEYIKDLETETEMNLDHVRKKLNDDDLYEHVTNKNNVSQRSFVFIPASRFKIPFLNPLSRPQKTKQGAYDKTFISNIDDFDTEPFHDYALRYDGLTGRKPESFMKGPVADAKPIKINSVLDNPFYSSILGSPMEKEIDFLTNKVKAANGIIHLQYNNVNNDLIHIEKQIPGLKSDKKKGYFKDGAIKMFEFSKPHKTTYENQLNNAYFDVGDNRLELKDYASKQLNIERMKSNVTGANLNDVNILGDRYDYVELIKPALLRPVDNNKPGGIKKAFYNSLNLDLPFQPGPYRHDRVSLSLKDHSNLLSEPYKSRQFDYLRKSGYLNSQPLESVTIGFDNQNPSNMLFNHLIKAEPLDSNPFRKDISSSNKKTHTFDSELYNLNKSNLSPQYSGKPIIDIQSQNYDFNVNGNNNRSPTSDIQSSASSPEATSRSPLSKSFYKQPYHSKLFGHDRLSSIGKSHNNFKLGTADLNSLGHEIYTTSYNRLDYRVQQKNPYQQRLRNNIVPYRITNKLKEQKLFSSNPKEEFSNQTESNAPIKHMQFYPEDIEEPEFHNSLLAKKVQEMRELGKQFNDDSTSRENDSKREMNSSKYVKNTTQDQKNRKVKGRLMTAKGDCVYPDCEMRQLQYKNFKEKPHQEKCDCEVKKRAPEVDISHNGQISPVFINASTDFEIK